MRIEVTMDCTDLDATATFWQAALGCAVAGVIEGRFVSLSSPGLALTLQRVAEPKAAKNRMHLDLLVDDVDAEVRRLEGLGASRLTPVRRAELGQTWFVLADPEGNEFCVAHDPTGGDAAGKRLPTHERWPRRATLAVRRREDLEQHVVDVGEGLDVDPTSALT